MTEHGLATDGGSGVVRDHITPDADTAEYDLLEIIATLEGKDIEELPSLYTQVNHFVESLFEDPPFAGVTDGNPILVCRIPNHDNAKRRRETGTGQGDNRGVRRSVRLVGKRKFIQPTLHPSRMDVVTSVVRWPL